MRFVFALLVALSLPLAARAEVSVSVGATVEVGSFRERLAPYGRWVFVAGYGDVWVPNGVRPGWRPYWDGRWVLTEYGWTFVSDEPWGWAAWHYGNWVMAADVGWVWVPGRVWAPAWVVWRRGGGYACWAPAPPVGVRVWAVSSPAWVVVEERHFTEPIARVSVRASFSATYVQRTEVFARPVVRGGIAVNPGPHAQVIAAAVGHPVAAVQATAVVGHGTAAVAAAPRATVRPEVQNHWARQQARARMATGGPQPQRRPAASAMHPGRRRDNR